MYVAKPYESVKHSTLENDRKFNFVQGYEDSKPANVDLLLFWEGTETRNLLREG